MYKRQVAASDGRVRVIHKEKNGGASSARNLGTKSASGKLMGYQVIRVVSCEQMDGYRLLYPAILSCALFQSA